MVGQVWPSGSLINIQVKWSVFIRVGISNLTRNLELAHSYLFTNIFFFSVVTILHYNYIRKNGMKTAEYVYITEIITMY